MACSLTIRMGAFTDKWSALMIKSTIAARALSRSSSCMNSEMSLNSVTLLISSAVVSDIFQFLQYFPLDISESAFLSGSLHDHLEDRRGAAVGTHSVRTYLRPHFRGNSDTLGVLLIVYQKSAPLGVALLIVHST